MLDAVEEFFGRTADSLGIEAAALKLVSSVLFSYVLMAVYNGLLSRSPLIVKHLYFITCGVGLVYFNYGADIIHSIVMIFTCWAAMKLLGGTRTMVTLVFGWSMGYLLVGYWVTQTTVDYSFAWTIPQCILTLQLIAVAFDYYDGVREAEADKAVATAATDSVDTNGHVKSTSQETSAGLRRNETALFECPSLLELTSMSYFPASVMVGPQIHLKVIRDYMAANQNFLPITLIPSLRRLGAGLLYLGFYQAARQYWAVDYLTTADFLQDPSFWSRATKLAIIMRIHMAKYIATWLISEGVCILSGITYDSKTKNLTKMRQASLLLYETTANFTSKINSFNLTTNAWAAKYIYKRMRWAGSKTVSHLVTLFVLAVWHGVHSGYYMSFFMEFIIVRAEWEYLPRIRSLRKSYPTFDQLCTAFYYPIEILGHVYVVYMWGYCVAGFNLFSADRYLPVYHSTYWIGHVIYCGLIAASYFLPKPKID